MSTNGYSRVDLHDGTSIWVPTGGRYLILNPSGSGSFPRPERITLELSNELPQQEDVMSEQKPQQTRDLEAVPPDEELLDAPGLDADPEQLKRKTKAELVELVLEQGELWAAAIKRQETELGELQARVGLQSAALAERDEKIEQLETKAAKDEQGFREELDRWRQDRDRLQVNRDQAVAELADLWAWADEARTHLEAGAHIEARSKPRPGTLRPGLHLNLERLSDRVRQARK